MIQQMLLAGDGEMLVNGAFNSNAGWSTGAGWSISDGKATSTGAGSLTQNLNRSGGTFQITFTVSGWAGTGAGLYVSLDANNGPTVAANGTYVHTITAGSSFARIGVNPLTGTESFSIESISMKKV